MSLGNSFLLDYSIKQERERILDEDDFVNETTLNYLVAEEYNDVDRLNDLFMLKELEREQLKSMSNLLLSTFMCLKIPRITLALQAINTIKICSFKGGYNEGKIGDLLSVYDYTAFQILFYAFSVSRLLRRFV